MTFSDRELLAIFNREVRQNCEWTRMRREGFPDLVRYTVEGKVEVGGGYISWSALTVETADTEIDRQVEHYRGLNMEFEWKVYSYDQPPDLGEHLAARGFTADEPEALMVAELEDLASDTWSMDLSTVRRVITPAEIDALFVMENEVWQQDISPLGVSLKHDLEHFPDLLRIFAVWDADRVVSGAWSYYLKPTSFVSLFGGSTLQEYRGRGYYRALLAARAREAHERGYRFLCVDASPDSQPILARNGFRCLATSTPYIWKPG